jgi:hypothetical protein
VFKLRGRDLRAEAERRDGCRDDHSSRSNRSCNRRDAMQTVVEHQALQRRTEAGPRQLQTLVVRLVLPRCSFPGTGQQETKALFVAAARPAKGHPTR